MDKESVKIGISGNTAAPCFLAIKAKGYEVNIIATTTSDYFGDIKYQFDAVKDELFFNATSPEELLGLIHMWELRGKKWQLHPEEKGVYKAALIAAPLYDENGNLIEDE